MKKASQANKNWHALYELASEAYEVAAWDWLYEDQLFGLRVPDSAQTWYVSIMGTNGEHLCYCFYKGESGLDAVLSLREKVMNVDESDMALLEYHQLQFMRAQNCIQVSFEEEELMSDDQLAHLERIGIQFGEDDLRTSIADWTPGKASWPIEEDQIGLLHTLLEKALDVAKQYEDDPEGLPQWEGNGASMPIYTATAAGNGQLEWTLTQEEVDCSEVLVDDYRPLYPNGWSQLKNMPKKGGVLVVGRMMNYMGVVVADGDRPFFMDPIIVFDTKTGEILGAAMKGEDGADQEAQILQILMDYGSCPASVLVADHLTLEFMAPCFQLANIEPTMDDGATAMLAMATQQMNGMLEDMEE